MKTAPKKGAGRKPKGEATIDSIIQKATEVGKFVKLGMTMTDSARAAGVNPRTLYSWLEKADKGQDGYEKIRDVLETDRAIGQAVLVQRIAKASEHDWRAAGWMLERRHPDTWGTKNNVNLSGSLGLQMEQMTEEELQAEIEKAERERG
jgi:AcrR family transcriptional regulator